MAATGYTPISLYYSSTASAAPTAGNLVAGELALNTLDEKLYFKNSAGVVKLLASNAGSAGSVTSVAQSFTGGLISVSGSPITTSGTLALTVAGTSGGVPYFSSASTWASSSALAQYGVIYGGGAGAAPAATAAGTTGQVLTAVTSGAPVWAAPATSGTVTSVAQSFTGGLISVSGSPVTTSGTLALTVAGTSGGIPYFSSGTAWASSAALTQYGIVYGGGAGAAPVATAAGTTGQVLTATTGGAPTWATPATSGTVTSVAQSFTGGLISVAGTPITSSGTLALTVAGTSGGIPYFSSASAWASSAALTQYGVIYGGGAGAAPVATAAGTTGQVLTATTGGAPTWATPAAGGVTSFSAGSTGLTPNSATTGAVTLAGLLGTGYGGTGLTAFTANGMMYASSTSALATSANVTLPSTGVLTTMSAARTGAALSTTAPAAYRVGANTYTDNTTAASGTAAHGTIESIGIAPIAATNASVTYTVASSLYIDGPPSASTNVTISSPYSLYVASGATYLGNTTISTLPAAYVEGTTYSKGYGLYGLAKPSTPTLTSAATGGSITADTYFCVVVAVIQTFNPGQSSGTAQTEPLVGASVPSTESSSVTTTGSTNTLSVSWTAVPGAYAYLVYFRRTANSYPDATCSTSTVYVPSTSVTLTTFAGGTNYAYQTYDSSWVVSAASVTATTSPNMTIQPIGVGFSGSVGGFLSLRGGSGGSSPGSTSSAGGALNLTGGPANRSYSTAAATGGAVNITGGTGGLNQSAVAGDVNIAGGSSIAASTAQAGSNVAITAQNGGSTGGNGGNVTITFGTSPSGLGTSGALIVKASTTEMARFYSPSSTSTDGALQLAASNSTSRARGVIASASTFRLKNRFLNGQFQVLNNVTTSFSGSTQTGAFICDRWFAYAIGTTAAATTFVNTSGVSSLFKNVATVTSNNAATTAIGIGQRIESTNTYDLQSGGDNTITISGYMSCDTSQTITWYLYYPNTADTWVAVGGTSFINSGATLISTGTFTVGTLTATSSFCVVIKLTGVAASNYYKGLVIYFERTTTASGQTLSAASMQVEKGPVPSAYDMRPITDEQMLCNRYYFKLAPNANSASFGMGYANNTVNFRADNPFQVPMRIAPTALQQSGTASNYTIFGGGSGSFIACSGVPTFVSASTNSAVTQYTVASGLTSYAGGQAGSNVSTGTGAYLAWSAEL